MILQVKRKKTNKQTGFHEIFLKPEGKCVAGVSTPYFKISDKQNLSKMKGVATTLCFLWKLLLSTGKRFYNLLYNP